VSGLVALLLAWWAQDLVFWLVLFAWGGLGASFGSVVVLSLYWRRTTAAGALAGLLVGSTVCVAWKLWLAEATGLYELIPAFGAAVLAVVVVSLLTGEGENDGRNDFGTGETGSE